MTLRLAKSALTSADLLARLAGQDAVVKTVTAIAASTQDAIKIAGRAGGTSSYVATLTPGTLTGNVAITVPGLTGTMAVSGAGQAVSFGTLSASGISTFSGTGTSSDGSVTIASSDPMLRWRVASGTADAKQYEWRAVASTGFEFMQLRKINDANTVFTDLAKFWNNGRVEFPTGPLIIGTDPGGSELLRVGGSAAFRFDANARLNFSTDGANGSFFDAVNGNASAFATLNVRATNIVLSPQSGNVGIGTAPTAGNGAIQLATHTTKAGGIAFGTDTFLFRVGPGLIREESASNSFHYFKYTGGAEAFIGTDNTYCYVGSSTNHTLSIRTNNTNALTIDTSQNTTLAGDLSQIGGKYFYLRGDASTDGSVRISSQSSGTAVIEKRASGTWTDIGNFS